MSDQSFDKNTPMPVVGGGIHGDTSTAGTGTKKDYGMSLAGNQRVPFSQVNYVQHLPGSPANGAPLHDFEFHSGHAWTEAPGKIDPHSGNGAV